MNQRPRRRTIKEASREIQTVRTEQWMSVTVRFRCSTSEEFIRHYCGDAVDGGMLVRTPTSPDLALGTLVKLRLDLHDGRPFFLATGMVAWTQPGDGRTPPGVGIRFVKISPASEALHTSMLGLQASQQVRADGARIASVTSNLPPKSPPDATAHHRRQADARDRLATPVVNCMPPDSGAQSTDRIVLEIGDHDFRREAPTIPYSTRRARKNRAAPARPPRPAANKPQNALTQALGAAGLDQRSAPDTVKMGRRQPPPLPKRACPRSRPNSKRSSRERRPPQGHPNVPPWVSDEAARFYAERRGVHPPSPPAMSLDRLPFDQLETTPHVKPNRRRRRRSRGQLWAWMVIATMVAAGLALLSFGGGDTKQSRTAPAAKSSARS